MIEEIFNPFGAMAKFHHIGLVVGSISQVNLQAKVWEDSVQRVKVAFILLNGLRVELIEPVGDNSPVASALLKNQKLVHVCYEVDDIEQTIRFCEKNGFYCFKKPVSAVAFENRRIAWVLHKKFGIFELLESKRT